MRKDRIGWLVIPMLAIIAALALWAYRHNNSAETLFARAEAILENFYIGYEIENIPPEDIASARQLYLQVLKKDPAHLPSLERLGYLAALQGKLPEARGYLNQIRRIDRGSSHASELASTIQAYEADWKRNTKSDDRTISLR